MQPQNNKGNIQERRKLQSEKPEKKCLALRIPDWPIATHALTNQNLPPICSDFWSGWRLVCVPCQRPEASEIRLMTQHATV